MRTEITGYWDPDLPKNDSDEQPVLSVDIAPNAFGGSVIEAKVTGKDGEPLAIFRLGEDELKLFAAALHGAAQAIPQQAQPQITFQPAQQCPFLSGYGT